MIDIIAGARPNFMKAAPIIRAIEAMPEPRLAYRLIHTGQHYDPRMSAEFFDQLGIPEPHINLDVGSGTQAEQTSAIMLRYERMLSVDRPSACLVVGDVTSTMACAIVARKCGVPVAHVEAGLRSGDWTMPEEINRVVTDAIATWFFTTSESAGRNLMNAGARAEDVFFVGNTMIDTLLANLHRLRPPDFWSPLGLAAGEYFVLTLHRPSNVDEPGRLASLLDAIGAACRGLPVVFPVHPRTAAVVGANAGANAGASSDTTAGPTAPLAANVHLVPPQAYLEFNYLVRHAKAVITDSGGITEEATVMGVPCLTLRTTTERPETVTIGTNELVGGDPAALARLLDRVFAGRWKKGGIPEKWDGRAAERIVAALARVAR